MNINLVKNVVVFATSLGAGAIVSGFVKSSMPVDVNIVRKGAINIGAFALSQLIGDKTADHLNKQIDETVVAVQGISKEFRDMANGAKKDEDPNDESTES